MYVSVCVETVRNVCVNEKIDVLWDGLVYLLIRSKQQHMNGIDFSRTLSV